MDDAFLSDICENPDDDTPRLVYADWLDDQGRTERAEFIRGQVALASMDADDARRAALAARCAELEKAHAKEWLRPLREALVKQLERWEFRRGFLDSATIRPQQANFLDLASAALAREPLASLTLGRTPDLVVDSTLAALGRAGGLGCVRALSMWGYDPPTSPDGLRLLGMSTSLARLTTFLPSLFLNAEHLAGLDATPLASRLETLSFPVYPGATADLLEWLLTSSRFPALRELWLGPCESGDDGLRRLAFTDHYSHLCRFHLQDSRTIGPAGFAALLDSPLWSRLTSFGLSHATLGDDVAPRLASAVGRLRTLRLAYAGLGPRTASALAAADWGALEELGLDGNPLGDAGVIALAESPQLAKLRSLNVYGCGIGDAGARALAESKYADGLRRVTVFESGMGLKPRRALKKRFGDAFVWGN